MLKLDGLKYSAGSGSPTVYKGIINQIRPHNTLVIPILGTGAVIRHMMPPERVLANDPDEEIIYLWLESNITWLELYSEPVMSFLKTIDWSTLGKAVVLVYPCYLTEEDHYELIEYLSGGLPKDVDVLVTVNPNKLYEKRLSHWRKLQLHSTSKKGRVPIDLYCNYPEPVMLHDDTFLGKNSMERVRLKKILEREREKMDRFNPLELQKFRRFVNEYTEERLQSIHNKTASVLWEGIRINK